MQCISPLTIRHGGAKNVVPCGKCNFCLSNKRSDWSFRLGQELKRASSAKFLTLTYADCKLPVNPTSGLLELCKEDMVLFMKRLRKENSKLSDEKIRFYSVGEYGTRTLRPHYHSIMFNLHPDVITRLPKLWQMGNIHCGEVTPASIHYVTKYVINRAMDYAGREPPFALMSRRPGIGADYLRTHEKWHNVKSRNYGQVNGIKTRLPRYYKDRFYNSAERALYHQQQIEKADADYWEKIRELSRFHSDPEAYYHECIVAEHNAITSKVNSLNTF